MSMMQNIHKMRAGLLARGITPTTLHVGREAFKALHEELWAAQPEARNRQARTVLGMVVKRADGSPRMTDAYAIS